MWRVRVCVSWELMKIPIILKYSDRNVISCILIYLETYAMVRIRFSVKRYHFILFKNWKNNCNFQEKKQSLATFIYLLTANTCSTFFLIWNFIASEATHIDQYAGTNDLKLSKMLNCTPDSFAVSCRSPKIADKSQMIRKSGNQHKTVKS